MTLNPELAWIGSGLVRPECVLCTRKGEVWTSDWRGTGGVVRIGPDGFQTAIHGWLGAGEDSLRPNGFALLEDGSFLLADLSEERAGVWKLGRGGEVEPFLLEVEGEPLPPANFVRMDSRGRVWVTLSTRVRPRALDYRPEARTGFLVLVDEAGARVVADGLGYANECAFDASEEHLFINETFARRLTRFRVDPDGTLQDREVVAEFGAGIYPDGMAIDQEGGIWIASIVSNRVIRVTPGGRQEVILDGGDADHIEWVETAFQRGEMARPHLDSLPESPLRNISSIAFGGADLRTVYLGCLLGDRIATFRSGIAGLSPVHWEW